VWEGYCFEGTQTELTSAPKPGGRQGGLSSYSEVDLESVAFGLGEKAAPTNLMRRRFEMRAVSLIPFS
jgi:hypothetical protein